MSHTGMADPDWELEDRKNPPRRLPDYRLPSPGGGPLLPVRSGPRTSTIAVLLHGLDCTDCRAYIENLAGSDAAIRDWDGRVVMIIPDDPPPVDGREVFPVLVDHD